ncbi:MAG: hypothetical protein OEY01_03615 [Desulfobulbaceae bacterium]|nr:hypothetical protein [Desulfobulbaceae bacterium]
MTTNEKTIVVEVKEIYTKTIELVVTSYSDKEIQEALDRAQVQAENGYGRLDFHSEMSQDEWNVYDADGNVLHP